MQIGVVRLGFNEPLLVFVCPRGLGIPQAQSGGSAKGGVT